MSGNWSERRKDPRWWALGGIAVILAAGGIIAVAQQRDDPPPRLLSLNEIACDTLKDHDQEFTYGFLKDIAADHPYTFPDADRAARLAIDLAQAPGGCS